jgi:hypothetical protein
LEKQRVLDLKQASEREFANRSDPSPASAPPESRLEFLAVVEESAMQPKRLEDVPALP